MSTLDMILDEVRDDVLVLMDESSDRAVLDAIVREGTPVLLAYKMRGVIPAARSMQRIATYLLALSAVFEDKTIRHRSMKEISDG